jgi:hypothetical protein
MTALKEYLLSHSSYSGEEFTSTENSQLSETEVSNNNVGFLFSFSPLLNY